ncbi:MAG: 4Fe-4S binding protein [Candidatus Eisenbacteria bacterium]
MVDENGAGEREIPLHYVCTRDEARTIFDEHENFWISDCGCREERGECRRSRRDVCLYVVPEFPPTGGNHREVSRAEADALLLLAEQSHLVTRPFRGYVDRSRTEGVCFCCDDCCGYFQADDEPCDKGASIASTTDACNHCGECVRVCYFGARTTVDGALVVDGNKCYGCGLCADVCATDCIAMMGRGGGND